MSMFWYVPQKTVVYQFSNVILILVIQQVSSDRLKIAEYSIDRIRGTIGFYAKTYSSYDYPYCQKAIAEWYLYVDAEVFTHSIVDLIKNR